jgi:hypothetical protein
MQKLPDHKGVVWRGYPDKDTTLAQYKLGRPIQWGAFTSTSTSFEATQGFTDKATGVIFKITVSSGKVGGNFCFPLVYCAKYLMCGFVTGHQCLLILSLRGRDPPLP